MKKLNNKGFTLVEIVIVIVIIAILAAMLVPSLTAWIDKANKKTFLEAANEIKTATTSYVSENYEDTFANEDDISDDGWTAINDIANTNIPTDYEVSFTCSGNKMTSFTVSNTKYTVTFNGTKWGEVQSSK